MKPALRCTTQKTRSWHSTEPSSSSRRHYLDVARQPTEHGNAPLTKLITIVFNFLRHLTRLLVTVHRVELLQSI
jgi:hypothetical protein